MELVLMFMAGMALMATVFVVVTWVTNPGEQLTPEEAEKRYRESGPDYGE